MEQPEEENEVTPAVMDNDEYFNSYEDLEVQQIHRFSFLIDPTNVFAATN